MMRSIAVSTCGFAIGALVVAAAMAQVEVRPARPGAAVVAGPQAEPPAPGFYRASELIGIEVRGKSGAPLGQIQDLVIDGRSQQVRYFILTSGQTVTAQSKLHVMPWAVVEPVPDLPKKGGVITVHVEGTRLQQAPAYTVEQLRTPTWAAEVDRYYAVPQQRRVLRPGAEIEIERGDQELRIERDGNEIQIERE